MLYEIVQTKKNPAFKASVDRSPRRRRPAGRRRPHHAHSGHMRDRVSAPPRTLVARAVRHCSRPAVARARARPPSRAAPATPRACRARLTARARRRDHRDHGDCARVRTVGKKKTRKKGKSATRRGICHGMACQPPPLHTATAAARVNSWKRTQP